MNKIMALVTLLAVASHAAAAPKRLTCEGAWTQPHNDDVQINQSWEAIFDTDDFAKESPQAEVTLTEWTKNGERHEGVGSAEPTIGRTYRMPYAVTPTTLTFEVKVFSTGTYTTSTYDVSRKDLSTWAGGCTIEDYAPGNAI